MEIKQKFEKLVIANRRFVIRQSRSSKQFVCADCGEPMLTTGQAAGVFGIRQRRVFQIIEADAAHFTETETGAALICIPSLGRALESEGNLTPIDGDRKEQ